MFTSLFWGVNNFCNALPAHLRGHSLLSVFSSSILCSVITLVIYCLIENLHRPFDQYFGKNQSKLKSICFKCANFLAEKIPKEKKTSKRKFKCECCCNVLGGPKENRVKFYQENYRVKITNSIKRGRRGKSRVNLVLGSQKLCIRNCWPALGKFGGWCQAPCKDPKGDGIPQSGDFCRDSSNSGLCRGLSDHALPALSLQPLLGGVPCSPSLAHSSSVYRAVHIYHIYHLQVHMSYPGSEIFHIPPSPSALPVSAPTGTGSQTNLTKEVILFYFFFLSSRRHRKKILL